MRKAFSLTTNRNGEKHDDPAESAVAVASWQATLRQAIFDAITEEDVKEIVRNQVEAAKQGDRAAIKFVMDYALGANQQIKLVQQNFYDPEQAAKAARNKRTTFED